MSENNTVLIAGKTAAELITTGEGTSKGTAFLVVNGETGALLTESRTGHSNTVVFTRPANTTAYAVNDAIGSTSGTAIFEFTDMCKQGGGEVIITSVELELDITTSNLGTSTLRLYNEAPTAIADNAAWDIPSGDRGKYLGRIKLTTPVDEGSTLFSDNDGINKQIKLTSTSLFVTLTTDTAFTPTSSAVKRLTIHTLDV